MGVVEVDSEWRPKLLDLNQVPGAFSFEEGFSRPDWQLITKTIEQTASQEEQDQAWNEVAVQWVLELRSQLGGDYGVRCSQEFILLSTQDLQSASQLLDFAERTLVNIYRVLGDAAWTWGHGKHVILLFAEEDDYYQYLSFFYREGVHPASAGCLLSKGYVHITLSYRDGRTIRRVLAHELTHNSVVHLRIPRWLNEGLALTFERNAVLVQDSLLDEPELRDQHLAFWNPENIQKFWSGVSFSEPGDSNKLSYSLAAILMHLLLTEKGDFGNFIKQARWDDAGQTASWDFLGIDLGHLAGTFLGEGNWRPNRKAMLQCWETAQKADTVNPPADTSSSGESEETDQSASS